MQLFIFIRSIFYVYVIEFLLLLLLLLFCHLSASLLHPSFFNKKILISRKRKNDLFDEVEVFASFVDMDAKFSRLQNFVNESTSNNNDNGQSWSRAIFSRDLFQTNIDRVQSFFNKRTDTSMATSSSTDDMQILLQKGDNDPILPALVSRADDDSE